MNQLKNLSFGRRHHRHSKIFILAIVVLLVTPVATFGQTQSQGRLNTAPWSIAAENQLPGTPNWQLPSSCQASNEIAGWADAFSVRAGDSVGIHVSTPARTFTVTAVRMGWYGGLGGREVWQSTAQTGVVQSQPTISLPSRMVSTNWPTSLTLSTVAWPPGVYLLRLNDSNRTGSYIPLVVSQASSLGMTVIATSDLNDAAYNTWGGYSLYDGTPSDPVAAVQVSFDRPQANSCGASLMFTNELPLIQLAEQQGRNVNYISDIDLETNPQLVAGASSIFITGHDEYWSSQMRATLFSARDSGVNLAFLGANLLYRHVRLQPNGSNVAARTMVSYNTAATSDPLYGINNADVATLWESNPVPRPSSALQGVQYNSHPELASLVVVDPKNFLFNGSGATDGTSIPFAVGYEFDSVNLSLPTPRPLEIVAHSPVFVLGAWTYSDAVYYAAPSGAGVFSSGTIGWIHAIHPGVSDVITVTTSNLLASFATAKAGVANPAVDNVASYYPTG